MATRFTHRLREALKKTLGLLDALNRPYALVGGLAVSAISVPRFTRDIDLAVAIADDLEAESVAFALQAKGYTVIATVEQEAVGRLATIRLRVPLGPEAPVLDLLFASCGIEPEIVVAAERLEVLEEVWVPVASIYHLIAMKILSQDLERRPQDRQDLLHLLESATEDDLRMAHDALTLIHSRGYHRGKDLHLELEAVCRMAGRRG